MFTGEYRHTVDDKGRLAIPARFRADLAQGATVSKWIDGCAALFPKAEWDVLAAKTAALPVTDQGSRTFQRFLFGAAFEIALDRQQGFEQRAGFHPGLDLEHRIEIRALLPRADRIGFCRLDQGGRSVLVAVGAGRGESAQEIRTQPCRRFLKIRIAARTCRCSMPSAQLSARLFPASVPRPIYRAFLPGYHRCEPACLAER